jgi:hypothetical protein
MSSALALIAAAKPAGGAAVGQIVIANVMAIVASSVLLWLVMGHRLGRREHLAKAAAFAERAAGLPGWVALPSFLALVSLMVALLGMYWDISLHIDDGRDPGPLANPAHYLILAGLFGIFCAGFIAMALPRERERPADTFVRINAGWYAPLGGVLMTSCAGFALLGFPLDDVWHRLFGQDVTLWGPTHLMLFGGAALTLIGMAVLTVEGIRARKSSGLETVPALAYFRRASLMGGLLIGLSTWQGEFDFGVPQFQMIFQPMLIASAAGVALVCARVWIGRGGALSTVAFFLAVRGGIALIVGPIFGETMPALPLYLAEAACVEVAGLYFGARRPLPLGIASGLGIGTVGFAAEYGWTNLVYRNPWNSNLLPEGVLLAVAAGVAGGVAGALVGAALCGRLPERRIARPAALAAFAVIAGLTLNGLITTEPSGYSARVKLTNVRPAPDREVSARVRITPASAADDARWLNATSWQGGGLVVNKLKKVSEGVYRTSEPLPVSGDWKTTIRLQTGRSVLGVPVYFPSDPAIPAPKVAAPSSFDRPFVKDHTLLQREQKKGVPGFLTLAAYIAVFLIWAGMVAVCAWGLARLGRALSGSDSSPRDPESGAAERAPRADQPEPTPA